MGPVHNDAPDSQTLTENAQAREEVIQLRLS